MAITLMHNAYRTLRATPSFSPTLPKHKFLADFAKAFALMTSAGYMVDGGQLKLSDGTSYKGNNGQLGNIYSVAVDAFWS